MEEKNYYVYILANSTNSTIYVGVTCDIARRLYEHKHKSVQGFTSKYNVNKLVYCEVTNDAYSAICREKQIKSWSRRKKNELIESINKNWEEITNY